MIFKYPNKFIVPVKEIRMENVKDSVKVQDEIKERNLIYETSQDLIREFKNNEKIWCDIDKYYCECEVGYI